MPPKKAGDNTAAKFQFGQAVIVAVITSATTLLVTYMSISTRHTEQPKPGDIAGVYSWQWIDDGWPVFGWIRVAADGKAEATLERWMMCDATKMRKRVPLLERNSGGRFAWNENSSAVQISLPVEFIKYDNNCNRTGLDPQTLRGELAPANAYKGTIDYVNDARGHFPGEMELLKIGN